LGNKKGGFIMNTVKKNLSEKNITMHHNSAVVKPKKKLYKQKLAGIILIASNIYAAAITNDSTSAMVLVPFGLLLLFSKSKLLDL